jgi:hypothetical protein
MSIHKFLINIRIFLIKCGKISHKTYLKGVETINNSKLTNNLQENKKIIYRLLSNNYLVTTRELILYGNLNCMIIYIDGLTDKESIEKYIISPLLYNIDTKVPRESTPARYLSKRYISINSITIDSDVKVICEKLKRGQTLVLLENDLDGIICDTYKYNFKQQANPKIEENIKGNNSAFVESLKINVSMIQEKLINNHLKVEQYTLGKENKSEAALMYVDNAIDKDVLSEIKKKLKEVKADYIPDTGYLMKYILDNEFSIFPQYKTVEKPDKVVSDLIQGKAVIFVNGCSYGVIIPVVFIEFFQAFEDYSNNIIIANFDRFLRVSAVIIILLISPIYLTLITYNIELIPQDLINIISKSRKDIPLPPFFEILIMEMIIEFLREGGLRLPSKVGQTLSIVGGIILGQAAIRSGLVSPTTLVVISISVICTFLIPIYEMSLSIRLCRFIMLILAQVFGLFGIMIGIYSLIGYLIGLENFGTPYLLPLAPMKYNELKDSFFRYPLNQINKAPRNLLKRRKKS